MTAAELEYFTVSGYFFDVQQPLAGGSSGQPKFSVISGYVTFTPRIPATVYVDNLDVGSGVGQDTALALTPIVGQIIDGELCSIDMNNDPGVQLVSNSAPVASALADAGINDLIYDVSFSSIVYAHQSFNLGDFAFAAPQDSTPVVITDPDLTRYAYAAPGTVPTAFSDAPVNNAYVKPVGGIPISDLSAQVQADLNSAAVAKNVPLRPCNNVLVGLGASIVTWSTVDTSYTSACFDNFIGHLCLESNQRIRYGGVIGHGGYTQSQIISGYLPTILAMNPAPGACVYFDAPFNDLINGVSFAQAKTNFTTVISALIGAGIVPIVGTIPVYYSGATQVVNVQWNRYVRRFAATHGLPLIDLATVMQDINGQETTSLTVDSLHPNCLGHSLIAQQALADGLLDVFAPAGTTLTSRWIGDLSNLLNDGTNNVGLFNTDTNADGIADGWVLGSGSAAKCSVVTPSTGDRLMGNWQQLTAVSGDAALLSYKTLASSYSAGDVLAVSARIQTSGMWQTGATWAVGFTQVVAGGYTFPSPGGGSAAGGSVASGCASWLSDVDDGVLYVEVPVLPGANFNFANLQLVPGTAAGTAVLRVGEFTVVNLTTGALLS